MKDELGLNDILAFLDGIMLQGDAPCEGWIWIYSSLPAPKAGRAASTNEE
jgi:hypothetical protein